jgi:hypothetical protein
MTKEIVRKIQNKKGDHIKTLIAQGGEQQKLTTKSEV